MIAALVAVALAYPPKPITKTSYWYHQTDTGAVSVSIAPDGTETVVDTFTGPDAMFNAMVDIVRLGLGYAPGRGIGTFVTIPLPGAAIEGDEG